MHTNPRGIRIVVGLVFVVLILFTFENSRVSKAITYAGENAKYYFDPSAEHAYEYGSRHFDATHPDDYDLPRAEYFFTEAVRLDAYLPYVHHQSARIAFLKGNFPLAIAGNGG